MASARKDQRPKALVVLNTNCTMPSALVETKRCLQEVLPTRSLYFPRCLLLARRGRVCVQFIIIYLTRCVLSSHARVLAMPTCSVHNNRRNGSGTWRNGKRKGTWRAMRHEEEEVERKCRVKMKKWRETAGRPITESLHLRATTQKDSGTSAVRPPSRVRPRPARTAPLCLPGAAGERARHGARQRRACARGVAF